MHANLSFLQGGGQLGELIRHKDWSTTTLGSPDTWPENLQSAVAIALNSGFPIAIYWGNDFSLIYNDAWSSIPGQKHPWALGQPGEVVWPEIWDGLREEFESVLNQGLSYRRPDAELFMHRHGYVEQCYFDYTLSPIVDVKGNVGGVFNAVIETSYRVITERRNGIRNGFLLHAHTSKDVSNAYGTIQDLLDSATKDISFYILYSVDADGRYEEQIASDTLHIQQKDRLRDFVAGENLESYLHLKDLSDLLVEPIINHWPEPVVEGVAIPLNSGNGELKAMLVVGASSRNRIDEEYIKFFLAVAANSSAILTNAYTAQLSIAYQKELLLNAELHEEQQVLNEELTAVNEELSAANEELAASNEELEVTNEELNQTQSELTSALTWLQESEGRFRNLIKEATVGIILLTGPNFIVEVVNDAYGKLIGRTAAELQDKPLFNIIPEAEESFRKIIEPVMETGEPVYLYEHPYFVYNGDQKIEGLLNLVYQPYRQAGGKVVGVMVLCHDVTEQSRARLHVEATERRYQFILNAIPQQVWTATPDGHWNYINQVVANDFGRPETEVVGLGWQNFIHPDDLPASLLAWQQSLQSGSEYLIEFRLKFANGEYVWHLARAIPLIEEGEVTLWLGTNTNIELQKENEQRKDEFLSIASHELKTPLTGIKAFTQLMRRSKDMSTTANLLEKSESNIQRLEKLINDLLDVTKINAGKLSYDLKPFDFSQMLRESVESAQLITSSHQIILEQVEPLEIIGDRLRLEQVVNNFLSNAIKYSPNAEQIIVKSQVSDNGLIVSITDFGIGIHEKHIQRLFDRYYRIDNTAMRFEGLGLGLFISSEILKRHMGSFWIESEPENGSTFYFRLPLNNVGQLPEVKENDTYYKDLYISMFEAKSEEWLEVQWTGFQTVESVKAGGMRMIERLRASGFHKVMNDNTYVLGTWSEASDWAGQVWFPMMEEAGLKYFAWVYSPSAFSRLSAEKAVDVKVGNAIVQFFTDVQSAKEWLNSLD